MAVIALALSGCGRDSGLFGDPVRTPDQGDERRDTIWDLFVVADDPNTTIEVNKIPLERLARHPEFPSDSKR